MNTAVMADQDVHHDASLRNLRLCDGDWSCRGAPTYNLTRLRTHLSRSSPGASQRCLPVIFTLTSHQLDLYHA